MRSAWARYFRMFPDSRIRVQETDSRGGVMILAGAAEGADSVQGRLLAENHGCVPAVWRASVRGNS